MTQTVEFNPVPFISREMQLPGSSVEAVVNLLHDGNTVPFIARYRKEATGSLDEIQIRAIEERATYLGELEKRRLAILSSIEEQGKLTDELKTKILQCQVKSTLEDLYLRRADYWQEQLESARSDRNRKKFLYAVQYYLQRAEMTREPV